MHAAGKASTSPVYLNLSHTGDCCFVSDAVAYITDEQSCLQDAEICMQQALSIDSSNSGAVAGLAECQDRLRICRQFNAQLS